MGQEALEKAIACYRGETIKKPEGNLICECFGITDRQIESAVRDHRLFTIEDITGHLKAGGGCGKCHENIQLIIDQAQGKPKAMRPAPAPLTNIQKIRLIEETLEREIKPTLHQDGGDIELVDVDGERVMVKLRGTCAGCKASQVTLKNTVEAKLRELVSKDLVVEEVRS
jgi:NifU-like protein